MRINVNSERRKFFGRIGLGALGAAIMNILPIKLFTGSTETKKIFGNKVSISINPMAVKRTRKS